MIRDVDALRDDQWERLRDDLVPGGGAGQRGPRCDNRRFVDALLWMARSGGRWCVLPARFGDRQAVKRHAIAGSNTARSTPFAGAHHESRPRMLTIDSTIVRPPARGRRPDR
jgi:transposase